MLEMRSCLYNNKSEALARAVSHYTVHFVLLLGDGCISCITIIVTYCTLYVIDVITGDIHTDEMH